MARQDDNDTPEAPADVEWLVDDEGNDYFVTDGIRYVLADDGYAYAVEEDLEAVAGGVATAAAGTREAPGTTASTDDPELPEPNAAVEPPTETAPQKRGRRKRRDDAQVAATSKGTAADDAAGPPADTAEAEGEAADAGATIKVVSREVRDQATATTAVDGIEGDGSLLQVTDLRSGYGALPVLHGVDFSIRRGETAVLLGLNGAGKTTTALNLCGALGPWAGRIVFDGQDITTWGTRRCVGEGIVMVPEGRRVFPDLSVNRNLQIGAWSQRHDENWLDEQRERVFGYFPRLRERTSQLAGTLSGGEQQMLAIARGLMARPKLLIIDEASMGLAPVIVHDVFEIVSQINDDGTTVLMIEQNISALEVADLGLVMEQGRMVKHLRGDQLRDRNEVTEVLMG